MKKCKFNQTCLNFLGHTISDKPIQIDDDKYKSIVDAPEPTDEKSLRSFEGLSRYYAKYIPRYIDVVEPLRTIL